jgi:hypothetical protein
MTVTTRPGRYKIIPAEYDVERGWGYAVRSTCSRCKAPEGAVCRTRAGGQCRKPHIARLADARHATANRLCAVRMRADDERFALSAGDVLVAVVYPYDPGKWTILARAADGFDPGCNQYAKDVEWIGWASQAA